MLAVVAELAALVAAVCASDRLVPIVATSLAADVAEAAALVALVAAAVADEAAAVALEAAAEADDDALAASTIKDHLAESVLSHIHI